MEKIKHVIEISTDSSSMILAAGEQVYQCYYGKKIATPSQIVDGYTEMVPAYSAFGGDDSTAALRLTHANGDLSTELVYVRHAAERMDANITETTVELKDRCYPVYVTLHYRAYAAEDVIEKWISVRHTEAEAITLNEFPSAELSFSSLHNHYYLTTLNGLWEREHNLSEEQLQIGKKVLDNRYGTWSSFGSNPSFMLSLNEPATEDAGQVIAGALAWSGAWKISFDYHLGKLFHDNKERRVLSVVAGINDFAADYKLDPGQLFTTPTFMQSYSGNGKGELSRKIHRWARKYSLRDGDKERPILLNSWEGAYFTFGEETLLSMMDGLNKMDGEMFVLDDGWFGNKHPRNNAAAGLGDWQVNNKKLPNGITALCDAAEARNLKFGIWVEPEMVNPASELYENHPEWVIHQPNREKILYRNQLVLDLSNPEVQDFVYDSVAAILVDSPKIAYVKWDCNRSFTNIGSSYLPADRQSHLWVDYTNGLYRIYDRLVENFPNVMIQACASGGGRIDYGILKRTQEFWTSDNTDALQRIFIQWGTGYMYPAIAMAAHVSACPNHQTGRVVPLKFRFDVAMSGRLGLELAPKEMSDDELAFVKAAVADYKRIRPTVQFGDLYRLISPYGSNFAALSYVSEDKIKAVAYAYTINHMLGNLLPQLTLKGLDPQKHYLITEINKSNGDAHITCDGKVLRGDVLMNHGLKVNLVSEYDSAVFELTEA